jgi:dTDP-4-amino-4,6-dideoxygalactose transaminase
VTSPVSTQATHSPAVTRKEIPLVDLAWQHREVAEDIESGWGKVLAESSFVLGEAVARFEDQFARYVKVAHCVGVGNGTDALEFALRALDVGPGDEVIVPTNSFVASAVAVIRAGAIPVLVDVDPNTQLIDLERVAASLTPRTRAVMPVHLYGQMVAVEDLVDLLDGTGVVIVEDAAQAHGSRRNGSSMGHRSEVAATSFYPGKNLGAYGDGGAVLSNSPGVAERVRRLRNLGAAAKHHHPEIGFNSRLDSLQAVVLSAKLARLEAWNELRRQAVARYQMLLADLERVELPVVSSGNEPNWHLFVVRVPHRDRVLRTLHEAGIGAGIHYPTPIHRQGAFSGLEHHSSFPVAERLADEILSLPIFPGISDRDQERVADTLRKALR